MTADRWSRVRDLFERCLDQPPEERARFLAAQSVEHEVRVEVEKLIEQDLMAGDFLAVSPGLVNELRAGPRSQFAPGDRLANRFELLRLIGRGGMGEVYAALDIELEEQVAVKVLHADLLGDSVATLRFRRELQLARKVTHPNVCRLFDLGRHSTPTGDVFFLTMELVEGETLATYLQRVGRLSVSAAQPIVEQLLNGLAAAHQAGIVHRDLKPSNVMLTPSRAVIMDFGLARLDGAFDGSALTSDGKVLGTLDYMAPEQLQSGAITERTDIYALGLLLYEITTGLRPFGKGDSVASSLKRLTQVPMPPGKLNPELPLNWSRTISATLELDPQHRPSSAQQVLEHLRGSGPRRRIRLTRRHMVTAAGISLAGVSSFYWRTRVQKQDGPAQGVSSIYLTDVINATEDPRFDGLTTVLRSQLSQSAQFTVLNEGQVRTLLAQMRHTAPASNLRPEIAREVALRHGPGTVVVYGSLSALGSAFVLSMRIEQPGSRPDEVSRNWTRQFNAGGEQDLMSELRAVAVWARESVGEPTSEIEKQNRATSDITTSSWDALQVYRQARDARAQGETRQAEIFLKDALRMDPRFVSALREMADLLVSESRLAEGFDYWKQAIATAEARNISSQERFRMEALFYDDTRDFRRAEPVYQAWAIRYPSDYVPLFYRAAMLTWLGRDDEAARNWEDSFALRRYAPTAEALGKLALLRGDLARAERWLGEIRSLDNPRALISLEARIRICRGAYAGALKSLAELQSVKDPRARANGVHLRAALYADANQPEPAMRILREEIARQRGEGQNQFVDDLTLSLAAILAERSPDEAIRLADMCLRPRANPATLQKLARIYRLVRLPARVSDLLRQVPTNTGFPVFEHARAVIAGEAAFAQHDYSGACKLLEQASAIIPSAYLPPVSLWEALVAAGRQRIAAQALSEPGLNPALLWRNMETLWPGVWRQCLALYASVEPDPVSVAKARALLSNLHL